MTPKDKAHELFDKYLFKISLNTPKVSDYLVKQCALIAVDEIIESSPIKTNSYDYGECNIMYWQEVKQEIEKL